MVNRLLTIELSKFGKFVNSIDYSKLISVQDVARILLNTMQTPLINVTISFISNYMNRV